MNFDLILKGSQEFYPKLNNKTYFVLKVDNESKQNFMTDFFTKFIDNQNKNNKEKHFVGIDFEFNKVRKTERDVALMQINLENNSETGYIFILYPPELSKKNLDSLIKLITHPIIYKILHGAESLDIPYLFNQLLNDEKLINGFCSNFYDTRFLCDYYHLENNIELRCSIYYLLLEHNVISKEKFEELEKIEEKTGPIYLINIDIHKLGFHVLRYSLYDVIYLPELIKKFLNMGWVYTDLVPEITCLINKYKRNIGNNIPELEKIITPLNIYFIYESDNRILLNEIAEIYRFTLEQTYWDKIQQIPYFKKFSEILSKFVVYQNIMDNMTVYINKKDKAEQINWNKYWKIFDNYPSIKKTLDSLNQQVQNDLKQRIN